MTTGPEEHEQFYPDALDARSRTDSSASTSVQFDTDDVTVTLWEDGGVVIRVTSSDSGP